MPFWRAKEALSQACRKTGTRRSSKKYPFTDHTDTGAGGQEASHRPPQTANQRLKLTITPTRGFWWPGYTRRNGMLWLWKRWKHRFIFASAFCHHWKFGITASIPPRKYKSPWRKQEAPLRFLSLVRGMYRTWYSGSLLGKWPYLMWHSWWPMMIRHARIYFLDSPYCVTLGLISEHP